MKRKTAIVRALKQRYDVKQVRIKDGVLQGTVNVLERPLWVDLGRYDEYATKTTENRCSTAVYRREIHISTIWGRVDS